MEIPGIDPGASRVQIERSSTWANSPCLLGSKMCNLFLNFRLFHNYGKHFTISQVDIPR